LKAQVLYLTEQRISKKVAKNQAIANALLKFILLLNVEMNFAQPNFAP